MRSYNSNKKNILSFSTFNTCIKKYMRNETKSNILANDSGLVFNG